MAVDIRPGESPPFSSPRRLFEIPEGTINTQEMAYDTLPNGEFLFAITNRPQRHRLVFHWLQEIDRQLEARAK